MDAHFERSSTLRLLEPLTCGAAMNLCDELCVGVDDVAGLQVVKLHLVDGVMPS